MKTIKLINFINLNTEQKEIVLSWRNHPNIKKWMFTNNNIQKIDHFNFIESLKSKHDKKYFLVQEGTKYIGVIDFTNISDDSSHIGIYKNPYTHNVGDILLTEIINFGFHVLKVSKLVAEVIEHNTKAIQLYKSKGFKIIQTKQVNSNKAFIMMLTNLVGKSDQIYLTHNKH